MDIGIFVALTARNASAALLRTLGREVEDRGFESVWVAEHIVLFDEGEYDSTYPYSADGRFPGPGDTGIIEPMTALGYLAAVTDRVRLGTAVCLVPQRNPVYLAKQVADIDHLSGGRVDLGIGVGWLREEFEAVGMPFEDRGRRCDDHVAVMRSLWVDEVSEVPDGLYRLRPCRMHPKPVQRPHPPIHVGGESDAALRRVARLGQGWFTWGRAPADLAAPLATLDRLLEGAGRSRAEVQLTVCPYLNRLDPDTVDAYRRAGVDRLVAIVGATGPGTVAAELDRLAWLLPG